MRRGLPRLSEFALIEISATLPFRAEQTPLHNRCRLDAAVLIARVSFAASILHSARASNNVKHTRRHDGPSGIIDESRRTADCDRGETTVAKTLTSMEFQSSPF